MPRLLAIPIEVADGSQRTWLHRSLAALAAPVVLGSALRIGRLFENRLLDAASKTILCFALLQMVLLVAHFASTGDAGVWNVFTMIEADRVWPDLASGLANQRLSALFALCVYGAVLVFVSRRSTASRAEPLAAAPRTNGVASTSTPAILPARNTILTLGDACPVVFHPGLALSFGLVAIGVAMHMGSLTLIERFVAGFPSVTDVFQAKLPYVDFGVPGELVFVAFFIACWTLLIRRQPRSVPSVLCLLGAFYAIRGVFLFLLPIGSPPTAPAIADRFVLYPHPDHAFFPGGHAGLMTILSLVLQDRRWRRAMLAVSVAFALGTIVARTHYTADALGGWVVGYALVSWGRRHLAHLAATGRPRNWQSEASSGSILNRKATRRSSRALGFR